MGNMRMQHPQRLPVMRASNPKQFMPPTANASCPAKLPPSYAQAQKWKRSGDDMDELCKKLQPAPSPQEFSYLNQFDGQELTITKQVNHAYQDSSAPSPAAAAITAQPSSAGSQSQQQCSTGSARPHNSSASDANKLHDE